MTRPLTHRAARSSRTAPTFLAAATALMGPAKDPFRVREGSTLAFDGTSTLRDWTCTAHRFSATVDSDPERAESILAGRKVTTTVLAEFPVANLECKNGTMNAHMRKARCGSTWRRGCTASSTTRSCSWARGGIR